MNTSSRIIHISDTHCTTRDYITSFNPAHALIGDLIIPEAGCPAQDTPAKCGEIVNFLISNVQILGTNRIVHTGDLVDSAESDDFNAYAKQYLLDPLTSHGFDVTVVPGNHDYFNDGVQFLTAHIAEGAKEFFNAFSSFMKAKGPIEYPVDLDLGSGSHLILINSLKGHYDVQTGSHRAQGNIGEQQLGWLRNTLPQYQQGRAAGNKVALAMHHSPFATDGDIELTDAAEFLSVIENQIDALMFGHTGDPHQFYLDQAKSYVIPLITSENIDHMQSDGYPISVIDLAHNEVEVYSTKHGLIAVEKGIPDTRIEVPLQWFATLSC